MHIASTISTQLTQGMLMQLMFNQSITLTQLIIFCKTIVCENLFCMCCGTMSFNCHGTMDDFVDSETKYF